MDKPWGLEKRSAKDWESLYWESIKRYPEMNKKYQKQQEDIAFLYQIIATLSKDLLTLSGFTQDFFNVKGQTIYFDFMELRAKLIRKQHLVDTARENYRFAVLEIADLNRQIREIQTTGAADYGLSQSKYCQERE